MDLQRFYHLAGEAARRVALKVTFENVDITLQVAQDLNSFSYTDNEEDKADDCQLSLKDENGFWLEWLKERPRAVQVVGDGDWIIGDAVIVNGVPQYTSYGTGTPGVPLVNHYGKVTHLNLKQGIPYPIHVDSKGWFALNQVQRANAFTSHMTYKSGAKGAKFGVYLIQHNWYGEQQERRLFCGIFEVDNVGAQGPPGKVTIKGTSLSYASKIRNQENTQAWVKVTLETIAADIAGRGDMQLAYESSYNPLYDRKEQTEKSDVAFLKELCTDAGICLKVHNNTIVLYDAEAYESKPAVDKLEKGQDYIKSYRFGTNFNDCCYASCHVCYELPNGGTIEATYTQPDAEGGSTGLVLEVNERVTSVAEAELLAKKRLRQKNKGEYTASFTVVGDAKYVTGLTLDVIGFGAFDGKYIISSTTHSVGGSGYTTDLTLRRCLEGY